MKIKLLNTNGDPKLTAGKIYELSWTLEAYFLVNDKGGVYWMDDLAENGIEWEFQK